MTNCPKCNNQCEDKALFCENCGNRIPPKQEETTNNWLKCSICGCKNDQSAIFCNSCGKTLNQSQQNEPIQTEQQSLQTQQQYHSSPTYAENLSLWGYYRKCLKKWTPKGRARRREFWGFFIYSNLVYFVLGLIFVITDDLRYYALANISHAFLFIYCFLVCLPNIFVSIRRMHDVGKSGWFILIPIYNLVLAVTGSEPGSNKYGPNPKPP